MNLGIEIRLFSFLLKCFYATMLSLAFCRFCIISICGVQKTNHWLTMRPKQAPAEPKRISNWYVWNVGLTGSVIFRYHYWVCKHLLKWSTDSLDVQGAVKCGKTDMYWKQVMGQQLIQHWLPYFDVLSSEEDTSSLLILIAVFRRKFF